jgi:hypothetical protein
MCTTLANAPHLRHTRLVILDWLHCSRVANHSPWPADFRLARLLLTFALAAAAFFARSVRCAGVMVSKLRLPPILPPWRPAFRKKSITSLGSFFPFIPSA